MSHERPESGWSLVTEQDEAAAIIGALLDLEPESEYARSELAESADVPLKTLYLVDTLEDLADAGMLERVDDGSDESEAQFTLNEDSEVLEAARAFDDAVARNLPADPPE